jgi:AraC-like DNA-binding protein
MYSPVKDGIERADERVRFTEVRPPEKLRELVHCYWELKSEEPLAVDFRYHVVPDACVNVLLDQRGTDVVAVTAAPASAMVLNLGTEFHYVGVQLFPGVWRGDPGELRRGLVDQPYAGSLPLRRFNRRLVSLPFARKQAILTELVEHLMGSGHIARNPVIAAILRNLPEIQRVADMARFTGLSTRQLQRSLRDMTGFAPHDFLKILRVQYSFSGEFLTHYSDQSHFIHSFRKTTGHTPQRYRRRFRV